MSVPASHTIAAPGAGPILLSVDGSAASREAAERGAALLAPRPAVAVSAWLPAPTFRHGSMADAPEAVLDPAAAVDAASEQAASAAAREVADALGARRPECAAEPVCVGRSTWRALLDEAEHRDASAIVVGSHERGAVARAVGSVLGSPGRTPARARARRATAVGGRDGRRSVSGPAVAFTTVRGAPVTDADARSLGPLRDLAVESGPPSRVTHVLAGPGPARSLAGRRGRGARGTGSPAHREAERRRARRDGSAAAFTVTGP
jgi:nucleotide-binding universal stress UspA family protein